MLSTDQRNESGFTRGVPPGEAKPDVARLRALSRHLNLGADVSDHGSGIDGDHPSELSPSRPTFRGWAAMKNDNLESDRPSLGRRMFRTVGRFFIGGGAPGARPPLACKAAATKETVIRGRQIALRVCNQGSPALQ